MHVIVTEDYEGIPSGTVLQEVKISTPYFYSGLWCSANGSYFVEVPINICEVYENDKYFEMLAYMDLYGL